MKTPPLAVLLPRTHSNQAPWRQELLSTHPQVTLDMRGAQRTLTAMINPQRPFPTQMLLAPLGVSSPPQRLSLSWRFFPLSSNGATQSSY